MRKNDPRMPMPTPWRYRVVTIETKCLGRRDQNGTKITSGVAGITREQVMKVFDSLPKRVRLALESSAHDWAAHWAAGVTGAWSAKAVVERIEQADAEESLRRELQLLRGEG